ncbi:glycosyltransferase [Uliginosibacterium sp. sgz301328]|uniref:glycosyltransferase n=1 Tax=Uliginosibacterium sp. sgz301328 TaxID=3243764 RepID=UPI00359CEE44
MGKDNSASGPLRVCFIITALGIGGAEHALLRILSRLDRTRIQPSLIVLGREDALAEAFREIGIEPVMLGLHAGQWPLGQIARFVDEVRATRPDIIQGWMYHGNLAASFAAARLGVPACWSIHDTPDAAHAHSFFTRAVIRLSGWYVGRVARIFNVAARSADYCAAHLGWPRERTTLLPNGVDTERFRPDAARRRAARQRWAVNDAQPVIGMVARWAPVKNHALFIETGRRFADMHPDAVLVLVGKGLDDANTELAALIASQGLGGNMRLLGARNDVEALVPGFDIATLTSRSEGFPNVLPEAMSCGVPAVSTDVGDARLIIGDTGRIADATPEALAAAWDAVWASDRAALGEAARARAIELCALDSIVARLQDAYLSISNERAG